MELVIFYIFSTLMLISALKVIINQKPVESVLYLIIVFCNAAILIVLLETEFIAILFIVVYVGAIAVLFLFVVIILNVKEENKIKKKEANLEYQQYFPFIICIIFAIYIEITLLTEQEIKSLIPETNIMNVFYIKWINIIDIAITTNIETFGQILYTYYIYYFLICGIILLVSLLATISLTLQVKNTGVEKKQKTYQQIARKSNKAIFTIK